jgi:hypothetical protein
VTRAAKVVPIDSEEELFDGLKLMASIQLEAKVKKLIYCQEMDYITVCLQSGILVSFLLEISK